MWAFIASRKEFGDKTIVSPNYNETYIVTTRGTWVPQGDAEWLLSIKWRCPACDYDRITVFGLATPTTKQLARRPKRLPLSHNDKSILGQWSRKIKEEK